LAELSGPVQEPGKRWPSNTTPFTLSPSPFTLLPPFNPLHVITSPGQKESRL
jgi:hypothetical protein